MKALALLSLPLFVMAVPAPAQDPGPAFPAGPGQAVVQKACAACHPPAIMADKHYDAAKWSEVVDQMIGKGAEIADTDYDVIVAYLTRTYGVKK